MSRTDALSRVPVLRRATASLVGALIADLRTCAPKRPDRFHTRRGCSNRAIVFGRLNDDGLWLN